jgi:hypothetical protein
MTLREELKDWTDIDWACFRLAVCLGLMQDDPAVFRGKGKHVFWSNNELGNSLYDLVFKLIDLGVIMRDMDGDDRVRWNPDYKGSWE